MKVAILLSVLTLAGCSAGNLDSVKDNAEETFNDNGFTITGYQGYEWGLWGFNDYGGARVWYTLEKKENGIVYEASLWRWGDEYHLYALKAKDAIQPK